MEATGYVCFIFIRVCFAGLNPCTLFPKHPKTNREASMLLATFFPDA